MAYKIKDIYPSQVDTNDVGFPDGKPRNIQGGIQGTGTPFEEKLFQDYEGARQALFAEAGVVPSGVVDKVGTSDFVGALKGLEKSADKVITTDGRNVQERLDDLPSEVDAAGTAEALIEQHNSDASAHPELSAFITSEADRAEANANSAAIAANVYADTTEGLTETVEDEQFQVLSTDGSEYIRYKHDVGDVATEVGRFPSAEHVSEINKSSLINRENSVASLSNTFTSPNLLSHQQYNCDVLPDEVSSGNFELVNLDGRDMIKGYVLKSSGLVNLKCVYNSVNINNFKSGKISVSLFVHSVNKGSAAKISVQQIGTQNSIVQSDEIIIHELGGSVDVPTEFKGVFDVNPNADREVRLVLEANRQASASNDREIFFHSLCLSDGADDGFRANTDDSTPDTVHSIDNLFDYANSTSESRLNATYGTVESFPNYVVSDFIDVSPLTTYSSNIKIARWAEYDSNKTLINTTKTNMDTLTTHSRARYVRLSLSTISGAYAQNFTRTDAPTEFIEFGVGVKEEIINIKNIDQAIPSSRNLIDVTALKKGSISDVTGAVLPSANIYYTDEYVEISNSFNYCTATNVAVVFYDSKKVFISRVSVNSGDLFKPPVNSSFARFSVNQAFIKQLFVCVGDELGYKETNLNPYNIKNLQVMSGQIGFMSKTDQLIDRNDLIYGYKLSSSGGMEEDDEYALSNSAVEIPEGETHLKTTYPLTASLNFYDAAGEFIERTSVGNVNAKEIPSGAASFKYAIRKSLVFLAMMNFGEDSKEWQEFGYVIDNDKLPRQQSYNAGHVTTPIRIPSDYYNANPNFDYSRYDFDSSVYTIDDLIDEWDQLILDNPDYLSSIVMGKDSSGLYDIIKVNARNNYDNLRNTGYKIPKIVIAAGLHGFEKHSMFDILLLIKDICENWRGNEVLTFLRWNVEIVFIPYCNPWGMSQGETAELGRRNFNGVDCNRNFLNFWDSGESDPTSLYYRGTAPMSEVETQYVDELFSENTDAIVAIDHHNHSGTDLDKLTWVQFVTGDGYHPYLDLATKQTFIDTANSFTGSNYGMTGNSLSGYTSISYSSTCSSHGHFEYGIPSILCETFKTMDGLPRTKALQGCVESMGNLIINIVRAKFS